MEREGLGDKKIVVWDHNRDLITHRANTVLRIWKQLNMPGERVFIGMRLGQEATYVYELGQNSISLKESSLPKAVGRISYRSLSILEAC